MWVLTDTTAALASMIGAERIPKPFQMAFDLVIPSAQDCVRCELLLRLHAH